MKMTGRIACVLLIGLVAGCSSMPTTPASTRLPMQHPYRLLLVRPDVQVRELTADGALSFREDWTDTARLLVAGQVQQVLAARAGGSVEVVGSEAAGADPARVAELHLRHDALGKMMPRPKTVGRSLGDAAIKLGEDSKSELLFITHVDYTVRTTGRKALIGVGMVGCAVLETAVLGSAGNCKDPDAGDRSAFASLVDQKTGEILWTTVVSSRLGDLRREPGARKLAKALVRRLPVLKPASQ
jgi:hypothetical protein